ncbi:MAG TPA: sigma 54-interacting transcriptional regulator [Candidatus Acidoferrum sp.]|nr:sigma 54-interacting transcriptional regulator [Candidatus Acidoferrum sp.]
MLSPRREFDSVDVQVLVDSIPALIHTARPDGYLDYFNKRWLEYFGATLEQVSGWNWTAFIHPEDVEGIVARWRACLASGEIFEYETRVRRADGEYRWMFHCKVPLRDGRGNIVKWYGSSLDIDGRKTAEAAVRRSEAYLAEAQRLSHTGSFGWKLSSGEIFWSEESFRIFQCDPKTKLTVDFILSRVHREDHGLVQQQIDRASRHGEGFDFEHRLQLPDDSVKHVRVTAHPSRDTAGNLEFVGAVTDVSKQRRAEAVIQERETQLQENTAKLEEAQRVAHVGYWEWDLRTDHVTWSDETYRIYGLHPQEPPIELATIRESIHPEDREFVFRKAAEAVQGEVRVAAEHRIVRPNGEVRVVHSQGDLKRDAAGLPWQMFGTIQDITDRKLAEDKIREQETELRQILDLAPQSIAVYGPNREPLYANRVMLDYHGLTLEKWRQRLDRGAVAHPDEWERVNRHFDRALASGAAFELEMRLRKSDGSYRWFLARFNPLRDEHGQIMRWYVAATDIEDRKQAEDRLRGENVALREEIDKASMFEEIVGTSPALRSVLSRISKVARSDSTVLITGETGTGKELVARAIHRRSDRSSRAFVSVNCAAIPRDLIASELFGHEKGAFTGAIQQRLGRFELANGGTIFLDEVGDLPAETQIALLRVLQEHEFERVGGSRRLCADVRVIAATNRNLQAAISAGTFRSDLFYRLNVFPIEIPSLRERRTDIPLLVEYFIDIYARKAGKNIKRVNKKTLELLQSYAWPGNIRELQNVIERSMILCESEIFSIDENWLPQPLTLESKQQVGLRRRFLLQEKDMIETALKDTGGRVSGPTGAAVKLGMPRSTMESKIRSLRINKNRFKS